MTYGVNAPLGLVATSYYGSAPYTGMVYPYPILGTYATALFEGDLVQLTGGFINQYTLAAAAATPAIGVFKDCTYRDTSGIIQFSKYWPAPGSVFVGTTPIANIITDPNVIFSIQCNATVTPTTANAVNKVASVSFAVNGNTSTGLSGMQLDTNTFQTGAANSYFPLHVIGFDSIPGNVSGTPYANLLVKLNNTSTSAGATGV